MCDAAVLHGVADVRIATQIRNEMRLRQIQTDMLSYGTRGAQPQAWESNGRPAVIAVVPAERSSEQLDQIATDLGRLDDAGAIIIVVTNYDSLDQRITRTATRVVPYALQPAEDVLESVIRHVLLGPNVTGIELRVRPSVMGFVSGVGWWNDAAYVVDTDSDSIVKVERGRTTIVWGGLDAAEHLAMDRFRAYVANKGADAINIHEIRDGGLLTPKFIRNVDGRRLNRPTGVAAAHGLVAIADTDGQRVVVTQTRSLVATGGVDLRGRWTSCMPTKPFQFACGVAVDERYVWVADTFNNRVVCFGLNGRQQHSFETPHCPVGIALWHDYVLVATDDGVVVGRRVKTRSGTSVQLFTTIEPGIIRSPFGLSVNVDNRLVVSDRSRHALWIVDLPVYLARAEAAA